jgi:hypothetical protein
MYAHPHRRVYESRREREAGHRQGASKSLTPAGVGKEGSGLDHGGGEGVPSGAGGEERAEAGGVDGEAEEERLAEQVAEAALPASATRGGDGAEEGDAAGVGGRRPGRQVRQARRDGHDRRRAPRGHLLADSAGGGAGEASATAPPATETRRRRSAAVGPMATVRDAWLARALAKSGGVLGTGKTAKNFFPRGRWPPSSVGAGRVNKFGEVH